MGTNCNVSCKQKASELEIKKTDPQKLKSIIKIQSHFKGYKSRKKFKQEIISLYQYKKKRLFNIVSQFTIKQSWELYFAFKQEYDFSINGLRKLRSNINEFYNSFFKISNAHMLFSTKKPISKIYNLDDVISESNNSDNEINTNKNNNNIYNNNNNNSSIEDNFINENDINFKQFDKVNIKKIKSSSDFQIFFRVYFLTSLSQNYNIGNLEKEVGKLYFDFEQIHSKTIPERLKDKHIFLVTNNDTKEILIGQNGPFFEEIIEELEEDEKHYCSVKTFQDNRKVYYQGSYKENLNQKCGLGKEYYIEHLGIKGEKLLKFKYCGYFKSNNYHGIGMLIKENGECYYGEFRNGIKFGYGYLYTNSYKYKGFFHNNLFEGYGEYTTKKYFYCGNFHEGLFNGFGFIRSENQNLFIGNFMNGKVNGDGCYKWNDGQNYYGSWNNEKMDGFGEFCFKNGDVYIGGYKNDLRDGKGMYIFKNGCVLKGNWDNGKKEGKFIFNTDNYFGAENKMKQKILIYENDKQIHRNED